MKAFVTGSHAYGTPGPASDIDLVVWCDTETKFILRAHCDLPQSFSLSKDDEQTVRYGKLNLIFPKSEESYAVWAVVTANLKKLKANGKPQNRELALRAFTSAREAAGVDDDYSY